MPGIVTSFNTRTGDVTLVAADITFAGGALIDSPIFTGTPTAQTAPPGTDTFQLATTAFVQAAIATSGVVSFNGRTGAVTLLEADVIAAGGAPILSPAFTGIPTAPTQPPGTDDTSIATTAFVEAAFAGIAIGVASFNGRTGAVTLATADITGAGGAPILSPTFTGIPAAVTAAPGTNTTQLATTAFVENAVAASTAGVASFNGRTGIVTLTAADITGAGGAPIFGPVFLGSPGAPTAAPGDNSTQIATTAFVQEALQAATAVVVTSFNGRSSAVVLTAADITGAGGALLASPALVGVPTAPTATVGTSTTQLATTAFVQAAANAAGVTSFNTRVGAVTFEAADITAVGGALLAGPAFTGAPTAPTAGVGTVTTQLATTAFVAAAILTLPANVSSFNTRTGAVTLNAADITGGGGALNNSPTFTGVPAAPTAGPGTSTTQLATTAFVTAAITAQTVVASFNGRSNVVTLTLADITGSGGAPIAGPTFTGVPSAPTAAPGTSTTQLATTAFVAAADALHVLKAGDTMTGDLTIFNTGPIFTLNKSTTNHNQIVGQHNGLTRWDILVGDDIAESGSNSGSNFGVVRFSDAGAEIDTPLSIDRASGVVTIGVGPANPGLNPALMIPYQGGSTQDGINFRPASDTNTVSNNFFNAAGTQVGYIIHSATATTYSTTSDARLKAEMRDFDAGPLIDALRPVYHNWIDYPDVWAHGLLAQEVNEIYPEAVTPGSDDESRLWGIDYAKFVPLLLAEVKELRKRIALLEA